MDDREEITRRVAAALEAAAERLAARGCSEVEVGKAMVGVGLAMWSKAESVEAVTDQLAGMTLKLAAITGQDGGPGADMPKAH